MLLDKPPYLQYLRENSNSFKIYIYCANINKYFAYLFVLFCSIHLKMFLESIKINVHKLYYRLKTFLLFEKLLYYILQMYQTCILCL